jgi:hypothetical protein
MVNNTEENPNLVPNMFFDKPETSETHYIT